LDDERNVRETPRGYAAAGMERDREEELMHARMTRYEGADTEAIEENLQGKKAVLPTEYGQTEGMKGAVFLVDRQAGAIIVISLWEDEEAMRASEEEATRVREEVTRPGETASVERYEVAMLSVEQAGGVG
jgi:heme-degrading monooxygenase HmoA